MKKNIAVRECTVDQYIRALPTLSHANESIPFLQAPYYGEWQIRDGKTVVYFLAEDDEKNTYAAGLAVKYDAPGGISFFYCPYGPIVKEWTVELYEAINAFFRPIAKRTGTTFARLDSKDMTTSLHLKPVANYIAKTASLQPRSEWLLNIAGDEENIWMGMHKHARYNVRLAERADARIDFYKPAEAPLDVFFDLMQTTAGRDSFSIQSRAYYEAVLQSIPDDSGFVAICTIDNKPAAASVFAAYDDTVHYVFSGSSDEFRKIAPPYFVIWNAILEARKRKWHTLNFGGITDAVKGTHLTGVTSFKKRFGGYEVTHENPVDLIYKPIRYATFNAYKRIKS